jgi:magnesium-transporting ATPase (P-type)
MMSVVVEGAGRRLLLTKGAPESVLSRCSAALANDEATSGGGGAGGGGGLSGISTSGRGVVQMTDGMRRSLLERMGQYGGEAWGVG